MQRRRDRWQFCVCVYVCVCVRPVGVHLPTRAYASDSRWKESSSYLGRHWCNCSLSVRNELPHLYRGKTGRGTPIFQDVFTAQTLAFRVPLTVTATAAIVVYLQEVKVLAFALL